MRILVTVNTYYPMLDGVQAVTDYLTTGLAQRGHQITVVTPCHQDFLLKKFIKILRLFGLMFIQNMLSTMEIEMIIVT